MYNIGDCMEKLISINGYWNTTFDNTFLNNDMWYGQIILNENGRFEGLVVDKENYYKGECLIGGMWTENYMEFIVISSFIDIPPIVYKAQNVEGDFFGRVYVLGEVDQEIEIGNSFVVAQDRACLSDDELTEYKHSIDYWKDLLMCPIFEFTYIEFLDSLDCKNEKTQK